MTETEVKGYSIWLIPDQKTQADLESVTQDLRVRFDGPDIPLHLTLLGQITDQPDHIVNQFRKLALGQSQLDLTFEYIGYERLFFRALYLKIVESPELLNLNKIARASFHRESDPPFLPHISLLYSSSEKAEKRLFENQIQKVAIKNIPMVSLELVRTQGPVSAWKSIEVIDL